jgi:serine O-acetyltransferase
MTYSEYKTLVSADLYRVTGEVSVGKLLRELLLGEGFKFCFWFRTCSWLRVHSLRPVLYPLAWLILRHYRYKLGISIASGTEIGPGLYIGHFGGIVVHGKVIIGKNCNLSHGVTLGIKNRGENAGCPTVGDNVYIGPGAKIFGAITIGNHAAIGANAVVTKDVPENGVAVGIPAKVISQEGSAGYVNRVDY